MPPSVPPISVTAIDPQNTELISGTNAKNAPSIASVPGSNILTERLLRRAVRYDARAGANECGTGRSSSTGGLIRNQSA